MEASIELLLDNDSDVNIDVDADVDVDVPYPVESGWRPRASFD